MFDNRTDATDATDAYDGRDYWEDALPCCDSAWGLAPKPTNPPKPTRGIAWDRVEVALKVLGIIAFLLGLAFWVMMTQETPFHDQLVGLAWFMIPAAVLLVGSLVARRAHSRSTSRRSQNAVR